MNANNALSFARLLVLLGQVEVGKGRGGGSGKGKGKWALEELLRTKTTATKRELYYRAKAAYGAKQVNRVSMKLCASQGVDKIGCVHCIKIEMKIR